MTVMFFLLSVLTLQPELDNFSFLDTDFQSISDTAYRAYILGDYETAAEHYLTFLQHNATDQTVLYNLACCYGLLGDEQLATEFLLRSLRAGFNDVNWISQDTDFDDVKESQIFSHALDSISAVAEAELQNRPILTYAEGSVMIPCLLKFPENYDPDHPVHLVIGLHGYGSNPNNFVALWDAFEDPDFIYAVPQAPYTVIPGADPGFSWMLWTDDEQVVAASSEGSYNYITNLAQTLYSQHNISKIWLIGLSQGCCFAYETAFSRPDVFDGAIGFGGWLDRDIVSDHMIRDADALRVFIAHGLGDTAVDYEEAQSAFHHLTSMGIDVEFHEFDGGHTVDGLTLLHAQEWMKK